MYEAAPKYQSGNYSVQKAETQELAGASCFSQLILLLCELYRLTLGFKALVVTSKAQISYCSQQYLPFQKDQERGLSLGPYFEGVCLQCRKSETFSIMAPFSGTTFPPKLKNSQVYQDFVSFCMKPFILDINTGYVCCFALFYSFFIDTVCMPLVICD